ncbi:hypothetical protein [uncultured Maribacter sp.]|uniref:hypothetical protein n=1 Tax=uncultured Maribacter sp. TaxID=431308 RepID=UPI00260244BF|nr:hypothetical protein [uncultured Maribacter sp.]
MQKTIYLFFLLASLSFSFVGCNNDDSNTTKAPLNADIIGSYKVSSIKSNTNLRTGGLIGAETELISYFTCGTITLEIKPDFTFIWSSQKIQQTYDDPIGFYSDLQCTELAVNGTVSAATDTSISLEFTHNNTKETAVFNLVNNKWQYQSFQDVFFQGHATNTIEGDMFSVNAILTMTYEKL